VAVALYKDKLSRLPQLATGVIAVALEHALFAGAWLFANIGIKLTRQMSAGFNIEGWILSMQNIKR
jgi:hypothetical protein